jgi:phosphomannomutase
MTSRLRLITNYWEGIVAADFTLDQVRQHSARLGYLLAEQALTCLVAYDTRFMSSLFAQDIYRSFTELGVPVSMVPTAVPLPAVQLALDKQQADCALIVSARNRPYWYNGLVLLDPGASNLSLNDDTPTNNTPAAPAAPPFPEMPEGGTPGQAITTDTTLDLRRPYIDMFPHLVDLNLIRRSTLTVFADPMHGTVVGYLPAVLGDNSQTKAIEINREPDPLFDRLPPLPAHTNLARLRKLVRESDSNLGLAFSADGTALGAVDKNGEQLTQLEMALLLASYLVRQYRQKGVVIAPPPANGTPLAAAASRGVSAWEQVLGFKVELADNPTERITEFLEQGQQDLLLGCTAAGEIIINKYSTYPDALIAGLLLVEIVARSGGSLRASLNELHARLERQQ